MALLKGKCGLILSRDASDPDPDPVGYPVDFVDPVRIWIWPDPKSLDLVGISGYGRIPVLY